MRGRSAPTLLKLSCIKITCRTCQTSVPGVSASGVSEAVHGGWVTPPVFFLFFGCTLEYWDLPDQGPNPGPCPGSAGSPSRGHQGEPPVFTSNAFPGAAATAPPGCTPVNSASRCLPPHLSPRFPSPPFLLFPSFSSLGRTAEGTFSFSGRATHLSPH